MKRSWVRPVPGTRHARSSLVRRGAVRPGSEGRRIPLRPHESAQQRRRYAGADAGRRRSRRTPTGQIKVTVYPSSQLGKLQELAEAVSTGTIALSHNTAGGIGSLHEPFGALDTPYLYRDSTT